MILNSRSNSRSGSPQEESIKYKSLKQRIHSEMKKPFNIEQITNIFQTKSKQDMEDLRLYFNKRIQYFQELRDHNHCGLIDQIIQTSKILTFQQKDMIYHYVKYNSTIVLIKNIGQAPDGFYMIIEGKVSVQSPNLDYLSTSSSRLLFEETLQLSNGSHFGDYEINEQKLRVHQVVCLSQKLYVLFLEKEGEISDGIYLILKGDFVICKDKIVENPPNSKNLSCKTFYINRLQSGQIFGEEDLYESQSRSYDIKCISQQGVVWILTSEVYKNVLSHNGDILRYLGLTAKQKLIYYEGKLRDLLENYSNSSVNFNTKVQRLGKDNNGRRIQTESNQRDSLSLYGRFNQNNQSLFNNNIQMNIDRMVSKIIKQSSNEVAFKQSSVSQRPSPIPNNITKIRQSPVSVSRLCNLKYSDGKSFQKKLSIGSDLDEQYQNNDQTEDDKIIKDNLKYQLNKTFRDLNKGNQQKYHNCSSKIEQQANSIFDQQKQKVLLSITTFNDSTSKLSSSSIKKFSFCQKNNEENQNQIKNDIISLQHIKSEEDLSSFRNETHTEFKEDIEEESINNQTIQLNQDTSLIIQQKDQEEGVDIQKNRNKQKKQSLDSRQSNKLQSDLNTSFSQLYMDNYNYLGDYQVCNHLEQNKKVLKHPNTIKLSNDFKLPKLDGDNNQDTQKQNQQNSLQNSIQQNSLNLKKNNKLLLKSLQITPAKQRKENQNISNLRHSHNQSNNKFRISDSVHRNEKLKNIILHNYIGNIQNGQFPQPQLQQLNQTNTLFKKYEINQKAKMNYLTQIYKRIKTSVDEESQTEDIEQINKSEIKRQRTYSLQEAIGQNKTFNISGLDKQPKRDISQNDKPNNLMKSFDLDENNKSNIEQIHKMNIYNKLQKISDKLHSTKTKILYIMHPNSFYVH